jgi:MarR family transcriptional regulator, organic hydroperoxide resistance regulator
MQDDRPARKKPAPLTTSTSLGHALVRAFRRVNRAHNRALKSLGLTAEQAHVLVVLWGEGPMKIGDLQRVVMLSSGTLTGSLDRMEKAGLLRRRPDPADGRAFIVEAADHKQRRAIEKTVIDTERATFAPLTAHERSELHRLLEKIP